MDLIKRALKMHRIFIAQEIKRVMEYKGDFFIGIIGFLLTQIFNILFIFIIFTQIPSLMGWNFNEIIYIYGFSLIPKALDHLLFDNLWDVGYFIIKKGEFDKYLTRPINTLFHIMVEKFQVDALGELFIGILLICYSVPKLDIEVDIIRIIFTIIVIPFATLIYTSIKIVTAAFAFWIKKSGNIMLMFYMINDFTKYPVTIYNNFVRRVITYIIPFAFTAFYPASYFLTGNNPIFNIGFTIIISTTLLLISIFIWNRGIKSYDSAGS